MTATAAYYLTAIADLGDSTGGSWASTPTVAMLNADDGTVATWNKPATAGVHSSGQCCSGFGTFPEVSPGDTIDSVYIEANAYVANAVRVGPWQYELWDGTTSIIGTRQTGQGATQTGTIDSFTITGVTYDQLATLQVRLWAYGSASNATASSASIDYIRLTVNYTPGTAAKSDSDAAQAKDQGEAVQATQLASGTETARGTDSEAVTAYLTGSDAVQAAPAGAVTAYPADADVGVAAEAQSVSEQGGGFVASADAASAADIAVAIGVIGPWVRVVVTEAVAAAEAEGTSEAIQQASDTESAAAAETVQLTAYLAYAEAGQATETGQVAASPASLDSAQATETGQVAASPASLDSVQVAEVQASSSASLAAAEGAVAAEAAQVLSATVTAAEAVRVTDAGEGGTGGGVKASAETAAVTEAEAIRVTLADSDRAVQTETGQFRMLADTDAARAVQAGELAVSLHLDSDQVFASEQQTLRVTLRDTDAARGLGNSETRSGIASAETSRTADSGTVSALVTDAETCVAAETALLAGATLASAEEAAFAEASQVAATLSATGAVFAADAASLVLAGVAGADAAEATEAASVTLRTVADSDRVRAADAGESGTGAAWLLSDADTVHVVDSDITYYYSAETAAAADAGEAIRATKVRSTDRVRVTDALGPVSGTWYIVSTDRARAADTGCWSGPLGDVEAARVTDDDEDVAPWSLTDDDYVAMSDDLPPLHVYAYALAPAQRLMLLGIRVLEEPAAGPAAIRPVVTAQVTMTISPALNITLSVETLRGSVKPNDYART